VFGPLLAFYSMQVSAVRSERWVWRRLAPGCLPYWVVQVAFFANHLCGEVLVGSTTNLRDQFHSNSFQVQIQSSY